MTRCSCLPLLACAAVLHGADAPAPALTFNDQSVVTTAADGGLRPAVGVHTIQVVRANRTQPTHADGLSHTYLHAPMLAWWHGQFHLDYLSAPVNEHDAPTATSYTSSPDGLIWTTPRTLFPALTLSDGSQTVMHQRASFYIAPGDRLLATGFHGKAPSPNDGSGLGRVVREINADGTFGPIYVLRPNPQSPWKSGSAPYPAYKTSPDSGFVSACEALLADRRTTSQWWEEDRSEDGFFDLTLKAISTVRRPDGTLLAIAKDAQHALSRDEGQTWQRLGFVPGLPVNSSKYWLQRTRDDRFVLALNPTNRLRHPLAIALSDDASRFGGLLAIHGELPPQRFPGKYKNLGPQYVRGISEGNGEPTGSALWLTYSVNKEDIWISRIPVPVMGSPASPGVHEDFSKDTDTPLPVGWNVYSPLWAPVRIIDTKTASGRALELRDEDPADYARVVRVFQPTRGLTFSASIMANETTGRLEIELLTANGARPLRIAFTEGGRIEANHEGIWTDAGPYVARQWTRISVTLSAQSGADRAAMTVDGKMTLPRALVLAEPYKTVERLSFRTGAYRDRTDAGHEFPGGDQKTQPSVFLIDDVEIVPAQ